MKKYEVNCITITAKSMFTSYNEYIEEIEKIIANKLNSGWEMLNMIEDPKTGFREIFFRRNIEDKKELLFD